MRGKIRARGAERELAVDRLRSALETQTRLRDHSEAARGTAEELPARAAECAAAEDVAARQRWLRWVEEDE